MSIRIPAALALLLVGFTAFAEAEPGSQAPAAAAPEGSAPAGPASEAPAPVGSAAPEGQACGAQAARYATEKGFTLWVTRRGTMLQENPLRPLTPARLVILQVVVNGRLATAFGPDYGRLQQGFAPGALETEGEAHISWAESADELPPTIQVLADDGHALFGPMRFVACGDAPKTKTVAAPPATPKAEPRPKGRNAAATPAERPRPGLPQGALPGLSIPKGAVD